MTEDGGRVEGSVPPPQTVEQLDDRLSAPTPEVVETLARLEGDILVLGVAGKLGPTLARMARRALQAAGIERRVIGVSRFSSVEQRASLEAHRIETIRCDLTDQDPLLEEWAALRAAGGEAVSEAHGRLFGHSRGLVCAFETDYGPEGGFGQPQALADIAGSYRAFGLETCGSQDERLDHVACECEFLCFLARKEAYTLGLGLLGDELEIVRSAERGFLRGHLGRFGRAFASRLLKEDSAGFFGALGAVLFAFLTQECRRFGVTPGLPVLALRPPTLDDAPLACGSASGCGSPSELIQVQRPRP